MTGQPRIVAAVALGGVLGALARYGVGRAFSVSTHGFPWATFIINVSGCFLMGAVMLYVLEVWPNQTYIRPFLATGVLGGYTTFSTYTVDVVRLTDAHSGGIAIIYLFGTLASAVAAVFAGIWVARLTLRVAA